MRRYVKLLILLLVVVLIFSFPLKVRAGDNGGRIEEKLDMMYFSFDKDEKLKLSVETFTLVGKFSSEAKALILFTNLIENNDPELIRFMPKGTKLLGVKLADGELIIDLSKQFNNHAGSAYEIAMVAQLIYNARKVGGVKTFTLMLEGKPAALTEGLMVDMIDVEENEPCAKMDDEMMN